jgi:hypothetical protein
MRLHDQCGSFTRCLHQLYPDWPIYVDRVPQDFRRPSFYLSAGPDRDRLLSGVVIESAVAWALVYFATSREDALATTDALCLALLDPGPGVPLYDFGVSPEAPTGRYMRVESVERVFDEDDAGLWSASMQVSTVLRLPRAAADAPAIGTVHVSEQWR